MPVVLRFQGYRFFFYSNEGDPREPMHIHVEKGGMEAKFWISPIAVAYNDGFNAKALRELLELVEAQQHEFRRAWHEFFGQGD